MPVTKEQTLEDPDVIDGLSSLKLYQEPYQQPSAGFSRPVSSSVSPEGSSTVRRERS